MEILKIATHTYHMQHALGHEEASVAKNRYANWQSKGIFVFAIATILSLGIATCFFIATAYFKHRRMAQSQNIDVSAQPITHATRQIIPSTPKQQDPSPLDSQRVPSHETTPTVLNGIFSFFPPVYPLSKGTFFLSLGSSTDAMETEIVPITDSILPNTQALHDFMLKNSRILAKINNPDQSIRYKVGFFFVSPARNAGASYVHGGLWSGNNFRDLTNNTMGRDCVYNMNLKSYFVQKFSCFKIEITEVDLEEGLEKGGIDIKEESDHEYENEDDSIEALFFQFIGMHGVKAGSQLRIDINSDIEKLSQVPVDLPEHLKIVYDQLLKKNQDYKTLFNLNDRYSVANVREAARKIAIILHPDKNPSHPLIACQLFSIMSKVRSVLEQEATS